MAENRMADVAKMFGKKLGEEFTISNGERVIKVRITESGLSFYHDLYNKWWHDSGALMDLLTGEAVIVE